MTLTEAFWWAYGLADKRRSHNGKVRYSSKAKAQEAAAIMETKRGRQFDAYRCFWGRKHYHVGTSVRRDT